MVSGPLVSTQIFITLFHMFICIESQRKASGLNIALEKHWPCAVVLVIDSSFAVSVHFVRNTA